jgi:hypothetical protein
MPEAGKKVKTVKPDPKNDTLKKHAPLGVFHGAGCATITGA